MGLLYLTVLHDSTLVVVHVVIFQDKGNIDDDDDTDNSLSAQKFEKCHIDITGNKDLTNVEAVLMDTLV